MTWDREYLKDKRILVVGCGGLAHAALPYLLSSGVGNLTLFDGDHIEISNLDRQHLFSPQDVGKNKANTIKKYCELYFPNCNVISEAHMYVGLNDSESYDLALDFTDRLATKMELALHFESKSIPYFYAAAQQNSGSSAFVHVGSISSKMLFGHIQNRQSAERNCSTDGVWPTVVAAVGIHVAHQALQFLCLSPCPFVGAIDYYDGGSGLWTRFHFNPKIELHKASTNLNELLKDQSTPIFYLGESEGLPSEIISITASELKEAIQNENRTCIIVCETGLRAKAAAEQLSKHFDFPVLSWNQDLDSFLIEMKKSHV